MNVEVLFFAGVRDQVGVAHEHQELHPGATVAELVEQLQLVHPGLSMQGVRIAVNEDFVAETHPLRAADVVALIPPVSGG